MSSGQQKKPLGIALVVTAIAGLGFLVFKLMDSSESQYKSQIETLIKDAQTLLDTCLKNESPEKCQSKIASLNALLERAGKPLFELPQDGAAETGGPTENESEAAASDGDSGSNGETDGETDGAENPDGALEQEGSEPEERSDAADPEHSNTQVAKFLRERNLPPENVAFQLDGKRYVGDAKLLFDRGVLASMQFELKARTTDEADISDEEFAAGKVGLVHQSSSGQLMPTLDSVGALPAQGPVSLSGTARTVVKVGDEVKRIVSLMSATISVDELRAKISGTISIDSQPKLKPLEQKRAVLALRDSGEIEYFQSFTFETTYTPSPPTLQ